jgi:hypothetical protein
LVPSLKTISIHMVDVEVVDELIFDQGSETR